MGLLDSILGRFGYVKNQPTKGRRQFFSAASVGRLTSSWTTTNTKANSEIFRDLKLLRARSRELARNNDYMKMYLGLVERHIVGPKGFGFQSKVAKASGEQEIELNRAIEEAFSHWAKAKNCDVTGRLGFAAMCRHVASTWARDGEVLIRKVRGNINEYGFSLQVLEADQLNENHNQDLRNGHKIIMGVEIDKWGRPVAYHINPIGSQDSVFRYDYSYTEPERVPASDVIHLYIPLRPHQVRGIPTAHAAMLRLNMLGGYEEAELVASRLAASKMGFYTRNDEGVGPDALEDDVNSLAQEAEPGAIEILPYGVDFKSWDPNHPAGHFDSFCKSMIRGIACGLGTSYATLSGDLTSVNFSSIRAGLLEERDGWMVLQDWFVESFLEKIYPDWLSMAVLAGKIDLSGHKLDELVRAAAWMPRRWQWVDPLKDAQANQMMVQMGVKAPSDLIREMGRDPEDVYRQIKADKEQFIALGLEEIWALFFRSASNANGKPSQDPGKPEE